MILKSAVDDRGRMKGIEFLTATHFRDTESRNFLNKRLAVDSGLASMLG